MSHDYYFQKPILQSWAFQEQYSLLQVSNDWEQQVY